MFEYSKEYTNSSGFQCTLLDTIGVFDIVMQDIYGELLHFIGRGRTLLYFPMQNVPKIRLSISSVVVAPVISSSGRRVL